MSKLGAWAHTNSVSWPSITGAAIAPAFGMRSSGWINGAAPEWMVTLGFEWMRTSPYQPSLPHGSCHQVRLAV